MNIIEPIVVAVLFAWTFSSIPLPIIAGIIMDYYKNPRAEISPIVG